MIHQAAAFFHQAGELACQRRIRGEGFELVLMTAQVLLQQAGVGAVVLGSADPEGLAIVAERLGVDREDGDEVVG